MTGNLNNNQIFIRRLTEIILANLGDENFGVKELAHESGMSPPSLNLRLQSIINKPINQFIRETRLHKALEMLQNGKVTASEVAYKVGFSSPAYFSTCFNEFFGYPPGQVKKINPDIAIELNSVQVPVKQEKKISVLRNVIIISSGILFIAVLVCLVYYVISNNSSSDADNKMVKDIDGNIYHALTIGEHLWMKEDLKTTKYNDGVPIPYVTDNTEWANLKSDAYCWPDNEESNKTVYGALYNWYTTNTAKLCPVGWHVPTDFDWETLINYCGGWEKAGAKLKEAGTAHWENPNVGATNEFGFTALPAGSRGGNGTDGNFSVSGSDLGYWCPPRCGDFRSLTAGRTWIYLTEGNASAGRSVRCVKNK